MAVYCEIERMVDVLRVGEVKRAEEFFGEMELNGVDGSCVTYEHLVSGYCKIGDVDSAFLLYKGMCRKGFRPESFTVDEVINGLCGKNRVSEALEYLMVAVKKLDIVPKGTSYEFCFKCAVFLFHQSKEDPLFEHPVYAELPRVIEDQPWPGKMLLAYKRSDPVKEKRIGKFIIKLVLPENANFETVKAVYQDNVLTVPVDKLPPPEPKKPKIMEVNIS
ncbi:hypothetical protein AgCh_038322 [Apium graveolens]